MTVPPRPRALIFDWDNTLVDTWPVIHAALNATLAQMGHPLWTQDETRLRVRASLRDSFPALFGERWEEAGRVYHQEFAARHIDALAPLTGAHGLLEHLSARALPLAVVSNKTGHFLRAEAAALGWTGHFHALVGSKDAIRDKPDRAPVDLALAGSGIGADETVWFVGDTGIDMACAHAAGCTAVLIGPGHGDDAALRDFPPSLSLPDLDALAALLKF